MLAFEGPATGTCSMSEVFSRVRYSTQCQKSITFPQRFGPWDILGSVLLVGVRDGGIGFCFMG